MANLNYAIGPNNFAKLNYAINPDNFEKLEQALDKLSPSDRKMAEILIVMNKDGLLLSDSQINWFQVLCQKAFGDPVPEGTEPVDAESELKMEMAADASVVPTPPENFKAIIAAMDFGYHHKSYPIIQLQLPDGNPIFLTRATGSSKHPGTVNVVEQLKDNKYEQWYGRVMKDGAFTQNYKADENKVELAKQAMAAFCANPKAYVTAVGHATSNCALCQKKLDSVGAVAGGVHPQCLKKFGMDAIQSSANPYAGWNVMHDGGVHHPHGSITGHMETHQAIQQPPPPWHPFTGLKKKPAVWAPGEHKVTVLPEKKPLVLTPAPVVRDEDILF